MSFELYVSSDFRLSGIPEFLLNHDTFIDDINMPMLLLDFTKNINLGIKATDRPQRVFSLKGELSRREVYNYQHGFEVDNIRPASKLATNILNTFQLKVYRGLEIILCNSMQAIENDWKRSNSSEISKEPMYRRYPIKQVYIYQGPWLNPVKVSTKHEAFWDSAESYLVLPHSYEELRKSLFSLDGTRVLVLKNHWIKSMVKRFPGAEIPFRIEENGGEDIFLLISKMIVRPEGLEKKDEKRKIN